MWKNDFFMATTQQKLYKVTKVKVRKPTPEKTCPYCSKKVAARGLAMHIRLQHPNEKKILNNHVIPELKEGMKVQIKKGLPNEGKMGIVMSVDSNGKAEIVLLEQIEKLYKQHCK